MIYVCFCSFSGLLEIVFFSSSSGLLETLFSGLMISVGGCKEASNHQVICLI